MSIESAKAFIERMETDKKFSQKFNDCKDAEARMSFVKGAGFNFTVVEVKEAGDELSSKELDMVIGGLAQSVMVNGTTS